MTNERLQDLLKDGSINKSWLARKFHDKPNYFNILDRETKRDVTVFIRRIDYGNFKTWELKKISKILYAKFKEIRHPEKK